jgi:hypothetical protein
VTVNRNPAPLVTGVKKALIHFSKAALEVASGIGDLVTGVTKTIQSDGSNDEPSADGPQKIDIE